MKLIESILTKNPCYTAGRKITVKGLMLHSIGCPQPDAHIFLKNWNRETYRTACVHAFIDGNDGTVYQTLPWDHRGWHCASGKNGSGNNTHIGVEMCEPPCIKYTKGSNFTCSDTRLAKAVAKRTYASAVELFAMLCKEYNLNPLEDGVIISHAEGYKRGIASNHGDPEHLWRGLRLPYTMDGFRQDVKTAMIVSAAPKEEKGSDYMFNPETIKYGSKGKSVVLLQRLLKVGGYKGKDGRVLAIDGDCGTNTVYAINSYQTSRRKQGVELGTNGANDSICGKKMWADIIGI